MAAPAYASEKTQPDFRTAPRRRPQVPERPRTDPSRRKPGTRPQDPRTPRTYPKETSPERVPSPRPQAPPPDYNPRPIVPREPPRTVPKADPFQPLEQRAGRIGFPALEVALKVGGKLLDWWPFIELLPFTLPAFLVKKGQAQVVFDSPYWTKCFDNGLGPKTVYHQQQNAGGNALCSMGGLDGQVPDGPIENYVPGYFIGGNGYVYPNGVEFGRQSIGGTRMSFDEVWSYYNPNGAVGGFPASDPSWPQQLPRLAKTPGAVIAPVVQSPVGAHDAMQHPIFQPFQVTQPYLGTLGLPTPNRDPLESSSGSYDPPDTEEESEKKRRRWPRPRPDIKPYQVPATVVVVSVPRGGGDPVLVSVPNGTHDNLPPGSGVHERKARAKVGLALGSALHVLGSLTEAGDLIDAVYKSIPANKTTKRRWKGRDGKWREAAISPQGKMAYIYGHYKDIVIRDAIFNGIENHFEDKFLGGLGNKLKSTYGTTNPYMQGLRGYQSGPAL